MSCPHAQTTTLSWLYGDGPEEHLHHVAACAHCQTVAAEHADALGQLVEPAAAPRRRGWAAPLLLGGSLLAAAAALLFVANPPPQLDGAVALQDSGVPVRHAMASLKDDLDRDPDSLDAQLAWLSVEFAPPSGQE